MPNLSLTFILMMNKLKHPTWRSLCGLLAAPLGLALLSSCAVEEEPAVSASSAHIRVRAAVTQTQETRAYQDQGVINTGHYYMTYPNASNNFTYSVCNVNFFDGYGVTTTQDGLELKWQEIGPLTYDINQTVFWLDNVPMQADDPNATVITFTDSYNPFKAGVFDQVEGTNDLLWGYAHIPMESPDEINIGIHHYMSRVSVIVTVDNSNEYAEAIDFKKGSVKLTNIIPKGVSYDRTTGMINLGDEPEHEDLYLANGGDWASITTDEENPGISYFQTQSFVLPPQQLSDTDRPRLVLDVPQTDGSIRTYSGVIPSVMLVNGSPAKMAFEVEKNLTLKVKLSQDLLYIETIFAYVQDWINKGTHLVTGSQAGVYSDSDFRNLMNAYADRDENELIHYGFKTGDVWTFDIFNNLTLDEKDIARRMAEGPDFKLDLTSHTLTINMTDGTVLNYDAENSAEAATVLYNLLRYGTVEGAGNGD